VQPNYTEVARKSRIQGIVIVEAIIDKDGNVDHVKVLKGLPMGLSEEAESAVKKWKFRPGTLGGQPVDVIFNLTVNFTLDGGGPATKEAPAVKIESTSETTSTQ
jgi:protein TonB